MISYNNCNSHNNITNYFQPTSTDHHHSMASPRQEANSTNSIYDYYNSTSSSHNHNFCSTSDNSLDCNNNPTSRSHGSSFISSIKLASLNTNSMSLTKTGGISGRFHKVLNVLCALLSTHNIVCLQDVRAPTNNFVSSLSPLFPNHNISLSSNSNAKGGVLTIIAPSLAHLNVTHTTIIPSSSICTTLTDGVDTISIYNCYLHPDTSNGIWTNQIQTLNNVHYCSRSILVGDLNHANRPEDRSSDYKDRSITAGRMFLTMLDNNGFEEPPQPLHTFYRCTKSKLTSSRIDHIYTNFDIMNLIDHTPTVTLDLNIPWTLGSYASSGRHPDRSDEDLCLTDRQVVTPFPAIAEGGSHITDHLPLSLRFSSTLQATSPPRIPKWALNHSDFLETFSRYWGSHDTLSDCWSELHRFKKCLFSTTNHIKKHCKRNKTSGHTEEDVWVAIRLLKDRQILNDDEIQVKYNNFEHLIDLATDNDTSALLGWINKELAVAAIDQDTQAPKSKLETLASTLPSQRSRLKQIWDPAEGRTVDDPGKVTDVLHNFWRNKWDQKAVKDPASLFRAFGRKIGISPKPIDLHLITSIITKMHSKTDSCPGPDGIPFQAYITTIDFAAPVLLYCINSLKNGKTPPEDFNAGDLYILPKKPTDRVEDTRPLVVNNTDNRIISSCINDSITPSVNTVLSPHQSGFRKEIDTDICDNIDFFNEKFYSAMEENKVYDILLIDFKKAFDSVSHEALFSLITHLGFPPSYLNLITGLFHKAHCYTTSSKTHRKRIDFHSGIKQGCPLSPTLFILVVEVLLDMLHTCACKDTKFYADDAALGDYDIVPKLPIIKKCLEIFESCTGLSINLDKTVMVSTGLHAPLRVALDSIGWQAVNITGSTIYLGIPIGHKTTVHDVYERPYNKFIERLRCYNSVKNSYSIPKRVLIWNTWLLSIFNYVFKFFLIPGDYLDAIDAECKNWLQDGNTIEALHYSRPSWYCGLTTPLRDTGKVNLAILISKADPLPYCHDNRTWTMRIRSQRQIAVDATRREYRISLPGGTSSTQAYSKIHNSTASIGMFSPYLRSKLSRYNITHARFDMFCKNFRLIPRWVPDYCRNMILRITHNMLHTNRRLGIPGRCYLCRDEEDSIEHLYGKCPVSTHAFNVIMRMLGWDQSPSLLNWVLAGTPLNASQAGLLCFLCNAVWRARNNAKHGSKQKWHSWIISDTLQRAHTAHSTLFATNFTGNTIPDRYKIIYAAKMKGRGKQADSGTPAVTIVNTHISRLPTNTFFAFTDGSARPNPGPTGAGVAIYNTNNPNTPLDTLAIPLGKGTNNAGELFAIGAAVEVAAKHGCKGHLHVYTDSGLSHNSLSKGTSAGVANSNLLSKLRATIKRHSHLFKVASHWIPAHIGISQNEKADDLAAKGSAISRRDKLNNNFLGDFVNSNDSFINNDNFNYDYG